MQDVLLRILNTQELKEKMPRTTVVERKKRLPLHQNTISDVHIDGINCSTNLRMTASTFSLEFVNFLETERVPVKSVGKNPSLFLSFKH